MIEMIDEPERGYPEVLVETRNLLREIIKNGGSAWNAKTLAKALREITPIYDWTHNDVEKFVSGRNGRLLSDDFSAHAGGPTQLKLEDIISIHSFASSTLESIAAKLREAGKPKLELELSVSASKTRMTFTLATPFAKELSQNEAFRQASQEALKAVVRAFSAGMREGVEQRVNLKKLDHT